MKVRTRFAPSPTGFMHVGGLRTALFAWLVAHQADGQFILRIEDTDQSRHVKDSEQHIMDSLRWLGLEWDEGPVRQSGRLEIYNTWAKKLINAGRAYGDSRTPQELDELRDQSIKQKRPFLVREHRPDRPTTWKPGVPLRFKSEPRSESWQDEVMGKIEFGPEAIDDFILIKADGYPTYNFAHVVDDSEMQISHVIRSQEFLPSIPNFLNLYKALGVDRPKIATLPYVLGSQGQKKLSKRDGAKDVMDYKKEGYLPETMVNFLASLGWNDGTEQEIFSVDELVAKFDLSRVQKSGARFDEKRLAWMNGQHIAQLDNEALLQRINAGGFWPAEASAADEAYKLQVVKLVKLRVHTLTDVVPISDMFFKDPQINAVTKLLQEDKTSGADKARLLEAARDELASSSFDEEDIKNRLNSLLEKLDTKPSVLFALIRIAISGQPYSPELFGSLSVLGKEKSLARLESALGALAKSA